MARPGDAWRCGEAVPDKAILLRCLSRELAALLKFCSGLGDSVLLKPDIIDDGTLLSLSFASLSKAIEDRL